MRFFLVLLPLLAWADGPAVDPTFLRRSLHTAPESRVDVSTSTCRYQALFGEGDPEKRIARGVSRFGQITVQPGGTCGPVSLPAEEFLYVVLEGEAVIDRAGQKTAVKKEDFFYLDPGVAHTFSNPGSKPARIVAAGYRIPKGEAVPAPHSSLPVASMGDVPKQVVGSHPPSTLYQLLVGDRTSKRDKLAAAQVMTSLFTMTITPGGTNHPHHHETEEEIYLLLEGEGDMVAGGGMNGIEGRHPAKPGDAYFIRLNCTVGYYARTPSRILALRSRFPFNRR